METPCYSVSRRSCPLDGCDIEYKYDARPLQGKGHNQSTQENDDHDDRKTKLEKRLRRKQRTRCLIITNRPGVVARPICINATARLAIMQIVPCDANRHLIGLNRHLTRSSSDLHRKGRWFPSEVKL
jgi:hypothetical protein